MDANAEQTAKENALNERILALTNRCATAEGTVVLLRKELALAKQRISALEHLAEMAEADTDY